MTEKWELANTNFKAAIRTLPVEGTAIPAMPGRKAHGEEAIQKTRKGKYPNHYEICSISSWFLCKTWGCRKQDSATSTCENHTKLWALHTVETRSWPVHAGTCAR